MKRQASDPTGRRRTLGRLPPQKKVAMAAALGRSLPRLPVGWRGLTHGLSASSPMVVRPGSTQLLGFEVRFLVSGPVARSFLLRCFSLAPARRHRCSLSLRLRFCLRQCQRRRRRRHRRHCRRRRHPTAMDTAAAAAAAAVPPTTFAALPQQQPPPPSSPLPPQVATAGADADANANAATLLPFAPTVVP